MPKCVQSADGKAEACVKIQVSASRRLRHQQDIESLAAVMAVDGYEDDRSARERRRFIDATTPMLDDDYEAWFGASSDAREALRLLRG